MPKSTLITWLSAKALKQAFLAVADPEGIVFKPNAVKISEFYATIDKQPGKLTWQPKVARISANGDLGFTAGPTYIKTAKPMMIRFSANTFRYGNWTQPRTGINC
jgi:hypothetical protein